MATAVFAPVTSLWESSRSTQTDDFFCSSDAMDFSSLLEHQHNVPSSPTTNSGCLSDDDVSATWSVPPSPSTASDVVDDDEDGSPLFGALDRLEDASIDRQTAGSQDIGDRDAWRGIIKLSDLEFETAAAFKPHRPVVQENMGPRGTLADAGVWWWLGQVHPAQNAYADTGTVDNAATSLDKDTFGELVDLPEGQDMEANMGNDSPVQGSLLTVEAQQSQPTSPAPSIVSLTLSSTSSEPLAAQIDKSGKRTGADTNGKPPADHMFEWNRFKEDFSQPAILPSDTDSLTGSGTIPLSCRLSPSSPLLSPPTGPSVTDAFITFPTLPPSPPGSHSPELVFPQSSQAAPMSPSFSPATTAPMHTISPIPQQQNLTVKQPIPRVSNVRTQSASPIPRPFHCEMCPATFSRKHDLKRHTR
ncbi:hypothetical protein SpCBS45565_g00405 [Spizellomyces sp. 'palustris']|nr:hypothetical protein SpCBS45565_g00405 [Spizellomyces sp. 'palustris']